MVLRRAVREYTRESLCSRPLLETKGLDGRCNCDPVRPHVTGSNDAILNDGGRSTAVSSVGAHPDQGLRRWGTALGHLLVVLPGNVSLQVWTGMTKWGWRLSSHKGQWSFYDQSLPRGGIMTLGHDYGLSGTNAGEHSCAGGYGHLRCLPRVPLWCRRPLGSTL
jgi:hypothetical protein